MYFSYFDTSNDFFTLYGNKNSIIQFIDLLTGGGLIFGKNNLVDSDGQDGWDGTSHGMPAGKTAFMFGWRVAFY